MESLAKYVFAKLASIFIFKKLQIHTFALICKNSSIKRNLFAKAIRASFSQLFMEVSALGAPLTLAFVALLL